MISHASNGSISTAFLRRCLVILFTVVSNAAAAYDGTDVYQRGAAGVVLIQVAGTQSNSSISEMGTGFIVSRLGYVLTAAHLFPDNVPAEELVAVARLGPDATASPQRYELQFVKRSPAHDAMLLKMVTPPKDLEPLVLRGSAPRPGEDLYVLGYPLGLPRVHILHATASDVTASDVTTDALINHGNSGGPALDAAGCVIGIVYSGIESHGGEPVTGIKFAVPLSAIAEIIPPEARSLPTVTSAPALPPVINVSDTLSRMKDDHPKLIGDDQKTYTDTIVARPGYEIEGIEAVEKISLNPPRLPFPVPVIASDKKSMIFTYDLISGPIVDQRRGWIEMNVHTRQRLIASSGPAATHTSFTCR